MMLESNEQDPDEPCVSRYGLNTELNDLLNMAMAVAAVSPGGAPSIKIEWHPYEAVWQVEANWSDNTRAKVVGNDVVEAVTELRRELRRLHAERLPKWREEHEAYKEEVRKKREAKGLHFDG